MIEIPEWIVTDDEKDIFTETLPKIMQVNDDTLAMLAAYSQALANMRRFRRKDPAKFRIWRGTMIYARNGLRISPQVFIDYVDLVCDCYDAPEVLTHLKREWQIERQADYMTAPLNF